MEIRDRRPEDLAAVQALLQAEKLPLDGLEATRGWVACECERVVGHVALDDTEQGSVLRSLVVGSAERTAGIGAALLHKAEGEAAQGNVFLRTSTIQEWVLRLGYERIDADAVPEKVSGTVEFSGVICSSVPVFRKKMARIQEQRRLFIFACIHNAGRSQMAAAYFNRLVDPTRAQALSAGTQPAEQVHPAVAESMRKAGFDLSGMRPQKLTAELAAGARMLITMGCGEQCPLVPGVEVEDWPLPDPKGQPAEVVDAIREQIALRVKDLIVRKKL